MLDDNVDCCVPGTVLGSGHQMAEAGAAPALLHLAELCYTEAGTIIITIITAQLRFRLGRKQAVPYYLYMTQLKFLRSAPGQ